MNRAAARDKPASLAPTNLPHMRTKRKVRIVHVFTPEIIKTDTENFSALDLVQQLTGKHAKKRRTNGARKKAIVKSRSSTTIVGELLLHQEETTVVRSSEMLKDESFCGGLLSGFGDAAEGAMFQDFEMYH